MKKELAVIGLGRMGGGIAMDLVDHGWRVLGYNRTTSVTQQLANEGVEPIYAYDELKDKLAAPRVIWLMLPSGEVTDVAIENIRPHLDEGDLIIDGANSYYKDTLRRAELLNGAGYRFMDAGVSGGPSGARSGACLMVGGERADYESSSELFEAVAAPSAIAYCGGHGAGHFTKMVHNGIEYGMMEAIAEGAAILKQSNFNIDLAEVFRVYNNRSVIESRLVGWAEEAFREDPELSEISAKISSTGEGEWTILAADELGVPADVIKTSFKVRQGSKAQDEGSPAGYRNKVVSVLREKFGRHSVRREDVG